jgi:hypothetical protein
MGVIKGKRVSVICFALLAPLMMAAAGVAEAKTLWTNSENADNKFDLTGDVRFRYESDHDGNAAADSKSDRTRERIRLRVGGLYDTGDGVEAGFQIRTAAGNLHSPHQNLGMNNGTTTTTTTTTAIDGKDPTKLTSSSSTTLAGNSDFGTDKAYIKYKNSGFSIWGGKNSWGILQVSEAWLDADVNPEGVNIGYKTGGLDLFVAQYIISTASFKSEADAMLMYGVKYSFDPGFKIDLAVYGLSTSEGKAGALKGGKANYNMVVAQAKLTDMFTLGAEYYISNMDNAHIGDGAASSDKNGLTVMAKAKIGDRIGIGAYYYDVGVGSVLEKGLYGQDDFNYSSNFTGTRFQIDFNPMKDVGVDIRYYTQKIKNGNLADSTGGAMKKGQKNSYDRIQANFNVKF